MKCVVNINQAEMAGVLRDTLSKTRGRYNLRATPIQSWKVRSEFLMLKNFNLIVGNFLTNKILSNLAENAELFNRNVDVAESSNSGNTDAGNDYKVVKTPNPN